VSQGLPDHIVQNATYRRGRLAVWDKLDPRATALLVIDMQNAWLAPGAPFETPPAREIVPAVNRLAGALRAAGGAVVWIRHTTGAPGTADYWSLFFDNFIHADVRQKTAEALVEDHPMHALYPALDVQPADLVVNKNRFSAFVRNKTDLEALLRGRGVDTLIISGTATNVCCESTAREAMMRDFRVFMPHDAVAAPHDDGHVAGLRTVMQAFADVRPVDEVISLMGEK